MTVAVATLSELAVRAPLLDEETERDLLRRIREDGDRRALQQLTSAHLRLVLSIAKRFARNGVAMEDLVSEGALGLLEAARRFDPDKGARYSTYASWWIRAKVRRFALENRRIVGAPSTRNGRRAMARLRQTEQRLRRAEGTSPTRERLAQELAVSAEDIIHAEMALSGRDTTLSPGPDEPVMQLTADGETPEETVARHEREANTRRLFEQGLALLDERERRVLERRLAVEPETLSELGADLGLSRERVRQIELGAKAKVRSAMVELVA